MLLVNGAYLSSHRWLIAENIFYLFFTTWRRPRYDIKWGLTRGPFTNTKIFSIRRLFSNGKMLWKRLTKRRDGNWRKTLMGNSLVTYFYSMIQFVLILFQTQIFRKKIIFYIFLLANLMLCKYHPIYSNQLIANTKLNNKRTENTRFYVVRQSAYIHKQRQERVSI